MASKLKPAGALTILLGVVTLLGTAALLVLSKELGALFFFFLGFSVGVVLISCGLMLWLFGELFERLNVIREVLKRTGSAELT